MAAVKFFKPVERAIADRDPDGACALAMQLAEEDVPGRRQCLAARLIDLYASSYVSVDIASHRRVCSGMSAFMNSPPSPLLDPDGRSGLCTVVAAMAVGMPSVDAAKSVKAFRPPKQMQQQGTQSVVSSAVRLSELVSRGRTSRAAQLALQMLNEAAATPGPAGVLPVCAVWDACLSISSHCSVASEFVRSAYALYCGCPPPTPQQQQQQPQQQQPQQQQPQQQQTQTQQQQTQTPASVAKTLRARRANLALCSVLVASSAASDPATVASLPDTWAGEIADAAIRRALSVPSVPAVPFRSESRNDAHHPAPLLPPVYNPVYSPVVPPRAREEAPPEVWRSPWELEQEQQRQQQQQQQRQRQPQQQQPPQQRLGRTRGHRGKGEGDGEQGFEADERQQWEQRENREHREQQQQQISYLQLYTTLDAASMARAQAERHDLHLDVAESGWQPKTIELARRSYINNNQ
jgi:hypothetical protein